MSVWLVPARKLSFGRSWRLRRHRDARSISSPGIARASRPASRSLGYTHWVAGTTGTGLGISQGMRELVRQLIQALEQDRPLILCQVVETRGSTPQKAGAFMVVDPDGGQVGTLGGGCVEDEVKQKAIRQIGRHGAAIQSFVLDHDYAWADGLICGGKMVDRHRARPRGRSRSPTSGPIERAHRAGDGFTEAVVVDPEQPATARRAGRPLPVRRRRTLARALDGRGAPRGTRPRGVVPLDDRPRPAVDGGVAFLPTLPRVRLVIVGRRARGPGGRRPGRAGRLRRLGGRRPPAVRQRRAVPDRPADHRRADRRGPAGRWRSRPRPTP